MTELAVLVSIALIMTVGVYGTVAAIVKVDDIGLVLTRAKGEGSRSRWTRGLGRLMVVSAPKLLRILSILERLRCLRLVAALSFMVFRSSAITPSLCRICC